MLPSAERGIRQAAPERLKSEVFFSKNDEALPNQSGLTALCTASANVG